MPRGGGAFLSRMSMNPIELHYSLKPFPLSEFGSYFTNFSKSAFRLEMLSVFNVPDEVEPLKSFLAGQSEPPADYNKEWREIQSSAKAAGKEFSRVRVIDGLLSNYLKFEISWAYPGNVAAGEDIRFIIRDEIQPFSTPVPILKDYWLFDESACFLMDYDYRGTFLGVTKLPEEFIKHYIDLMNETKKLSIPMNDALKKLGM